MARLVAMVAGGDHIGSMPPTFVLRQQVLTRRLQARCLAKREAVRCGEAGAVSQPHREFAVETTPFLKLEGGITGGDIAVSHGCVL